MLSISRILLLDDDANAHEFVKDILQQLTTVECHIVSYYEYDTAMQALEHEKFDLCIIDYILHDVHDRTGVDFINMSVKRNPYLPCVLFTGTGNNIIELEGMQVGAVDYIDKTKLNRHAFQRSIQYALRRARTMKELYVLYQQTHLTSQYRAEMMRLASHDIKNPLSSISLSLQILKGKSENLSKDDLLRHIERIESSTNRIKNITEDILDYDKLTAHEDFEPTNLTLLIQSVIRELTIQGELQNKSINYVPEENLPRIRAIPGQIREVLHNLISNSIKYTDKGGQISIEATLTLTSVTVSISDDGIGIDEIHLQNVFQPFFRVTSKNTEHIEGTGLGLYLVKQIVERHKGTIKVSSTPGSGSTFTFHIPAIDLNA